MSPRPRVACTECVPLLLQLLQLLLVQAVGLAGRSPLAGKVGTYCRSYGGCYPHAYPQHDFRFVPAPPGKTPRCARPGATFCETADHYPTHLVQYLIDRWAFDVSSLLKSESLDDFNLRLPVAYGVPHPSAGVGNSSGHQPHRPAATYGPPGPAGYPERRYHLDASLTSITYPPPAAADGADGADVRLHPVSPNPRGAAAWTRYRRQMPASASRGRERRQASAPASTLCPTSATYVTPQAALNTQGNWMFVANVPEVVDRQRYTQLVRAETCISSECDGICSLPIGYSSRCEQQYVQKRLVALGASGDRLYTDTFWFPHCCVCQITPTQDLAG